VLDIAADAEVVGICRQSTSDSWKISRAESHATVDHRCAAVLPRLFIRRRNYLGLRTTVVSHGRALNVRRRRSPRPSLRTSAPDVYRERLKTGELIAAGWVPAASVGRGKLCVRVNLYGCRSYETPLL